MPFYSKPGGGGSALDEAGLAQLRARVTAVEAGAALPDESIYLQANYQPATPFDVVAQAIPGRATQKIKFEPEAFEAAGEPILTWRIGARGDVDLNQGEAAGSDLIAGTVFSLSGWHRITASITFTIGSSSRYTSYEGAIFKVQAGQDDELIATGDVGVGSESQASEDTGERRATIPLTIAPRNYAPEASFYLVITVENNVTRIAAQLTVTKTRAYT